MHGMQDDLHTFNTVLLGLMRVVLSTKFNLLFFGLFGALIKERMTINILLQLLLAVMSLLTTAYT